MSDNESRFRDSSIRRGDKDDEVVKKIWNATSRGREACSLMGWLDSSALQNEYVLPLIGGPGSKGNWLDLVMRELKISTDGRWLSLGCGSGTQEIWAAQRGLCRQLQGYDISPDSIEIANKNVREKGLSNVKFEVGNFHKLGLPSHSFHVVMMAMSLHHVSELNKLLPRIARWLKPGGWFLVNEYIGPSQFQFGDKQLRIVNDLLDLLPDRLRHDYVQEQPKEPYVRHSREHWFNVDPSESICSDKIEKALNRYFHVVLSRPYGGTILNPLLEHIVGNFSENEHDLLALRFLGYLEQTLIREGILDDNFAVFAAQPRRGPLRLISLPHQILDRLRIAWWRHRS